MFWDAFIWIIMVDTYLYGLEILRRLVIRNVTIIFFWGGGTELYAQEKFRAATHMLGIDESVLLKKYFCFKVTVVFKAVCALPNFLSLRCTWQLNRWKYPKGPFINYVTHLGGEVVSRFVTKCDGGWGGLWNLLHNVKVYLF